MVLHFHNVTLQQLCSDDSINAYITNLTSSYTDKSNEASMVSASIIMFVLAGLFFNLNLFSGGLSDVSAILDPKVRLVLTSALSLFLPVMSYLFSEAKQAGAAMATTSYSSSTAVKDFSLRAGLILVWMLLVELLRKKVDDIPMRGYSFSDTIHRAGRVVWLGSLVFFNIQSAGRKAVFAILWILCATKVVQRIAFTEAGKRSYVHGKSARLITSYMAQTLKADHHHPHREERDDAAIAIDVVRAAAAAPPPSLHGEGEELLKRCNYIVTGEDNMVKECSADGYDLDLDGAGAATVVTVGKIWKLEDGPEGGRLLADFDKDQRLRRLCLSFALFKLLRRRFEHKGEITEKEASDCRDLVLRGLCKCKNGEGSEEALFHVMSDELNFLCEYYHSVVPVVLASPFFLFTNYLLLPIVVFGLCLMTVFLCGRGDLAYALYRIQTDNFVLRSPAKLAICLLYRARASPPTFFTLVDLSITSLLFIIFFYEEVWEFLVFLLSNWFMLSLIGEYASKPGWRRSPSIGGTFRRLMWLRSKMSRNSLCFRQFSVLNLRWPTILGVPAMLSLMVPTVPVPSQVKRSIRDSLLAHDNNDGHGRRLALTSGKSALEKHHMSSLSWACESSRSISEVLLTWHIATSLLQDRCPPRSKEDGAASHVVATTLSKYCAYLVAFHPELLPGNPEKTELVYEAVKVELKATLGCAEYYCWRRRARVDKIMEAGLDVGRWTEKKVVKNGATLAKGLVDRAAEETLQAAGSNRDSRAAVWKALADVWTELVIYVAPSRDEECVKGHENVLVHGGEFVTMLWALATHIGLSRQDSDDTATTEQQHGVPQI